MRNTCCDRGSPGETVSKREVFTEGALEFEERPVDHPSSPDAVPIDVVLGVRKPFRPVPVRHGVGPADHCDPNLIRIVKCAQRSQDRAYGRTSGVAIPGHGHGRETSQRHRGGKMLDHGVGAYEPSQRDSRNRFEFVHGTGLRRHEPRRQPLSPAADTNVTEIRICAAALPHSGSTDHRPQHIGIRMRPFEGLALTRCRAADVFAQLVQVAQIVFAILVRLRGARTVSSTTAGDHTEHRDQHHRREHEHHGVRSHARGEHQGHHAHHGRDHDHGHQLGHEVAGDHTWDLRRRLQCHLTARCARHRAARTPVEPNRTHAVKAPTRVGIPHYRRHSRSQASCLLSAQG